MIDGVISLEAFGSESDACRLEIDKTLDDVNGAHGGDLMGVWVGRMVVVYR